MVPADDATGFIAAAEATADVEGLMVEDDATDETDLMVDDDATETTGLRVDDDATDATGLTTDDDATDVTVFRVDDDVATVFIVDDEVATILADVEVLEIFLAAVPCAPASALSRLAAAAETVSGTGTPNFLKPLAYAIGPGTGPL